MENNQYINSNSTESVLNNNNNNMSNLSSLFRPPMAISTGLSASDNLAEIKEKSINKIKLNQKESDNEIMYDDTDINVSESRFQKQKNTNSLATCVTETMCETSNSRAYQVGEPSTSNTSSHIQLVHNCNDGCVCTKRKVAVYDKANHISQIQNIEKKTSILKSVTETMCETSNSRAYQVGEPSTSNTSSHIQLVHNCNDGCICSKRKVAVYDKTNHISQIQNIEKKTSILKSVTETMCETSNSRAYQVGEPSTSNTSSHIQLVHNCNDGCICSKRKVAVYDKTNHISQIQNIEKKTSILKSVTETMCETSNSRAYQVGEPSTSNTSSHIQLVHNCNDGCICSKRKVAVYDKTNHISQIQNIEKKTSILKSVTETMCETSNSRAYQVGEPSTSNTSSHIQLVHNCNDDCVCSKRKVAVYDKAKHISQIQNIEKNSSILKIVPSCLGNRRFKFLEKNDKLNETKNSKEINIPFYTNIKNHGMIIEKCSINYRRKKMQKNKRERSKNRICKDDICSLHGCSRYSVHQISVEECAQIKKIFSTFEFSHLVMIESKKKQKRFKCPLSICDIHLPMINIVITCQMCGKGLDSNLDPEEWKMYEKWNLTLSNNDIPLKLEAGMFLCMACQNCITEDSFEDIGILQRIVKRRNHILISLFGPSQDIRDKVSDKHLAYPKIIANMYTSNNMTKIRFTDPVITSTHYFTCDERKNKFNSFKSNKLRKIPKRLTHTVKTNCYQL